MIRFPSISVKYVLIPSWRDIVTNPSDLCGWKIGYFATSSRDEIEYMNNFRIYVDGYDVYCDEEDFYVFGNTGIELPKNFKKTIYTYRDRVKKVGNKYYVPDQDIWDKPFRIRLSDVSKTAVNNYYITMNPEDEPYTYYRELSYFYHLDTMDYGCNISAWTEGSASAIADDVLRLYDNNSTKGIIPFCLESGISKEDLENFEEYFLNVINDDSNVIGYYFIRFIQDNYGKSVVLKINENIKGIQKPFRLDITQTNRNKDFDKKFIDAIKKATSKNVFKRFVEEVIVPEIDINPDFLKD